MRSLETKVPPVALTAALGLAGWFLAELLPSATIRFRGQFTLSALCLLAGAAISLLGVKAFKDHKTTVNPTAPEATSQVVTSGVYKLTRNPMYVGFGLILLATVVLSGNIAASVVIPVYVVYMTELQIKPEERVLLAKFGAPYGEYMATVRRWL